MKKLLISSILFISLSFMSLYAQESISDNGKDYYGNFCLVSQSTIDTNYFSVDLSQLSNEFEKTFFKNYFIEQDVFHTRIISYNITDNKAIVAVPQKYQIKDFRHFIANMRKMTATANYNWTVEQKKEYVLTHKDK